MLISIQVSLTEEILIDFGVKSSTSLYIIWAQVIDDFCQLSSRLQKIFFSNILILVLSMNSLLIVLGLANFQNTKLSSLAFSQIILQGAIVYFSVRSWISKC